MLKQNDIEMRWIIGMERDQNKNDENEMDDKALKVG